MARIVPSGGMPKPGIVPSAPYSFMAIISLGTGLPIAWLSPAAAAAKAAKSATR